MSKLQIFWHSQCEIIFIHILAAKEQPQTPAMRKRIADLRRYWNSAYDNYISYKTPTHLLPHDPELEGRVAA